LMPMPLGATRTFLIYYLLVDRYSGHYT
jgi:hypothetical protein